MLKNDEGNVVLPNNCDNSVFNKEFVEEYGLNINDPSF